MEFDASACSGKKKKLPWVTKSGILATEANLESHINSKFCVAQEICTFDRLIKCVDKMNTKQIQKKIIEIS